MKFEDEIRTQLARQTELRYRILLEFDGSLQRVDGLPENDARDWLWSRIRGGTMQSSRLIIREITPVIELNGQPVEFALARQGLTPNGR